MRRKRFVAPCAKLVVGFLVAVSGAVVRVAGALLLLDIGRVLGLFRVGGRVGGRGGRGVVGNDNGAARVGLQ